MPLSGKKGFMMGYYVSTIPTLLNPRVIHGLLVDKLWCPGISLEQVKRLIKHSLCIGAYIDGTSKQIGFARVITDYTTHAYFCDLVVNPAHQRKGVGTMLLDAALHHPELRAMKTWSLRTTPEARKLYEAKGFMPATDPGTILEIEDLQMYLRPGYIDPHSHISRYSRSQR